MSRFSAYWQPLLKFAYHEILLQHLPSQLAAFRDFPPELRMYSPHPTEAQLAFRLEIAKKILARLWKEIVVTDCYAASMLL